MAGYVFVSYSRQDSQYVARLVQHLRAAGLEVWVDTETITGDRWTAVIPGRIDQCAAFLVVMTPAAEESRWVDAEIVYAISKNRPIMPLLLDGQPFPSLVSVQHEPVTHHDMPSAAFVDVLRSKVQTSREKIPRLPAISVELAHMLIDPASGEPLFGYASAANELFATVSPHNVGEIGLRSYRTGAPASPHTVHLAQPAQRKLAQFMQGWNETGPLEGARRVLGADLASGHIADLAWSADGSRLAIVWNVRENTGNFSRSRWEEASRIFVWELSGEPVHVLTVPGRSHYVAWSPDGRCISVVDPSYQDERGRQGRTLIQQIAPSRTLRVLPFFGAYAWSPDGQYLALGGAGAAPVSICHVETGAVVGAMPIAEEVGWIVWAPGAQVFAVATGSAVRIGHMGSGGSAIRELTGHTAAIWSVCYSPDGTYLATGSSDQTVRLWRASTGEPIDVLVGHTAPVSSVVWSQDGSTLISSGPDGVRVWQVSPPAARERSNGTLLEM